MVGGGNRKDESVVLNSTNVFAALGSLKKKKKSEKGSSKSSKSGTAQNPEEAEKEVFWAPAPLNVKSWADVDDEDEDDYYATTAPPELGWAGEDSKVAKETEHEAEHVEVGELVSESEEEGLDEVDDVDEEHENELEAPVETEPLKKPLEASPAPKDTERQLSKKELKKKGLEELEAVLAELGYGAKSETGGQDDSSGIAQEKKVENLNGEVDKKENATGESKSAKKKKKKDKSLKEPKESPDQPDGIDVAAADEDAGTDKGENTSAGDVKERLKKVASMKKKKSSKEMDAAARAAASEAAARNARLAAAKKKEKNHYNQQPVR
ncbi:hypothetical protein PRUPE_7G226700 [Prunus persica]|uniref:Uncharacterized protein n=1 Tax=Prunus persica TaxID=3760 RepID=M5VQ57_PRUPE|nr:uncharacterized protein LOC18771356 [Prunus persica]ONH98066.1 hypothetical protein PRUPE_7G226700 [Prunus persica]